ncbi:C45 family autoproteolytic acyltransferase/hydolase [Rhizobium sp. BR 249]|uniref:C45 family autoproteolytic acyltransferase/hydolase n=1 Tax=Rhizobium sp. BR 249 TaxID=3040011 RepID=UPI0039BF644E
MNPLSKPVLRYQRREDRPHLVLNLPSPFERGRQRAEQLGSELLGGLEAYDAFFRNAGLTREIIRDSGLRVIDDLAKWRSRSAEELDGVAQGAGVDLWKIAALNARTELLGMATNGFPGECTTLAYVPTGVKGEQIAQTFGVQTWDWNEELNDYWHTQSVKGGFYDFVGITEHGILGKIGVNSNGLALFLNILAHEGDAIGGIPIHILAATVLEEAGSVQEAINLLRTAPVNSSTALTLMDKDRVVSVELSPVGVFEVAPNNGYLLHTNHFLTESEALNEKPLYRPDTHNRYALVSTRLETYGRPHTHNQLLEFLYSDPDQAHLCCLPAIDAELGKRWRTLTTIVLDPLRQTANVLDGSPVEQRRREWLELRA